MNGEDVFLRVPATTTHSPSFESHGSAQMIPSCPQLPTLPDEIQAQILEYLSLPEVYFLRGASTHYLEICLDVIKRKFLRDSIVSLEDRTYCPHQFNFHGIFGDRVTTHVCWALTSEIQEDVAFGFGWGWLKVRQIKPIHVTQTIFRLPETGVPVSSARLLLSLGGAAHWSRCLYVSNNTWGGCNNEQVLRWWLNHHDPNIWIAIFPLGLIVKLISMGPGDGGGSSHFLGLY
jgi:hypothetical protein